MAMGKKTVNSLGVLGIAVIAGGAYFGLAAPLLAQTKATELELQQAQQLSQSYTSKLTGFQGGQSDETKAATDTQALFEGLVAESLDIESASRALAASLPSGVKLESFDFGAIQQVSSLQDNPTSISGFQAPPEFAGGGAAAAPAPAAASQEEAVDSAGGSSAAAPAVEGEQGVNPDAPISGFSRVPFTIQVTADSYAQLSAYLNSLSGQPRLISVVSVDSTRAETISATIYAFAFSGR